MEKTDIEDQDLGRLGLYPDPQRPRRKKETPPLSRGLKQSTTFLHHSFRSLNFKTHSETGFLGSLQPL